MDKAFWESIKANDYAVPEGRSLDELTDDLLDFLVSPDPALRDDYCYTTMAYWMIRRVYSTDQMRQILRTLLPRMQAGIGEQGTNSVFGRSFAALMLGYVINEDNKTPFLEESEVKETLNKALEYLANEKDLRGWLPEKGWAHSAAHTADLLWFLAKNKHIEPSDLKNILHGMSDKMAVPSGYLFVHGEDERMARAILAVMSREDAPLEGLTKWLTQVGRVIELTDPTANFDPKIHSAYYNTKNLLRSIYFKLAHAENPPQHVAALKGKIIEELRKFEN